MDALARLNQTLSVAAHLLDDAAGQVRDAALSPTQAHIRSIGETLVAIFEIQNAIYKLRPELAPVHEEAPEEVRNANKRLGEILIAAYGLADEGRLPDAIQLLRAFVKSESSAMHSELATIEIERIAKNYGA
jgi:hypothetical protein